jgi:hypothetical protein
VKRVMIANTIQVRMIAHAKIKTDTIDTAVLAQLYASGFLLKFGSRMKRRRPSGDKSPAAIRSCASVRD